jgi:hypothetical protein
MTNLLLVIDIVRKGWQEMPQARGTANDLVKLLCKEIKVCFCSIQYVSLLNTLLLLLLCVESDWKRC